MARDFFKKQDYQKFLLDGLEKQEVYTAIQKSFEKDVVPLLTKAGFQVDISLSPSGLLTLSVFEQQAINDFDAALERGEEPTEPKAVQIEEYDLDGEDLSKAIDYLWDVYDKQYPLPEQLPEEHKNYKVEYVSVDAIQVNPLQHRNAEAGLDVILTSMASGGQDYPIRIWANKDGYILIDGERRLLSAKKLGWKKIRAEVVPETEEVDLLGEAARANYQRQNPDSLETAQLIFDINNRIKKTNSYLNHKNIISDEQKKKLGTILKDPWSIPEEIAHIIQLEMNYTRQQQYGFFSLLKESPEIQAAAKAGEVQFVEGEAFIKYNTNSLTDNIAKAIKSKKQNQKLISTIKKEAADAREDHDIFLEAFRFITPTTKRLTAVFSELDIEEVKKHDNYASVKNRIQELISFLNEKFEL